MIHLATGLAISEQRVLLVASRYANHAEPLWNLPGGRQQPGELLSQTVAREILEETGLRARVLELAYISESYDGPTHFLNATFLVDVDDMKGASLDSARDDKKNYARSLDSARDDKKNDARDDKKNYARDDTEQDHVVGAEWVPLQEVGRRIVVAVVREPLLAYLKGELSRRYAGFHHAGITIEWPAGSQ